MTAYAATREEFKRHSKEPDWTKLKGLVADPIRELRDRIAEEVRRRESPDSLVPIDRDPVPPQIRRRAAAVLRAAGERPMTVTVPSLILGLPTGGPAPLP